ncbi:NAD-dependent malic enzyme [Actinomycetospora corticicola]|uniref:Malate dehydrogenase (Oxaloacetate-decarboxylating) n=1 Tax=Actinomycetospora corticicola TaxID=663602 RepID=A0A7Y9DTP9_9PSEU|nr:NAD-dependent malic enzyme [Actinomycetospora corticicola]NYD35345.1 malate dehydrogenase (oxaloacetate-decarboxylating) [Actinomycetospora corticicola]
MTVTGTGDDGVILDDPMRTKGTAFTAEERAEHGLRGLLPYAVTTLEDQVRRCWGEVDRQATDLQRYVYLRSLQDRNEHLFYSVLAADVPTALPLVYTPTVAEGCKRFSELWRRPRGLYLAWPDRDALRDMLRNRPHDEVDVIVVTDGQRILGIGDQGVGGMGIPVGKLSLYTLIGGIDPARTLPILLDVGTDNPDLLDDPFYLGWRHRRIDDEDYFAFVEDFVAAVEAELPEVLLQWEDFATPHAAPILARYRDRLLTFNDDIQGTAAVALGALQGAAEVAGTRLADQQVVMLGAGSAGIGVMEMVRQEMVDQGRSPDEARSRCWVVDVRGLLTTDRDDLSGDQRAFAHDPADVADWDVEGLPGLADVVEHVTVGVLLGLSTAQGAFTEDIVRSMAAKVDRPVVFPLSNPTANAEARPAELDSWTDGRALIATGSPFPPLARADGPDVPVAQCNNVYIFPAVGLAVTAAKATRVTDAMMRAAARALGDASPALHDPHAPLLPAWADVRAVADGIALAVARQAVADGVAPEASDDELRDAIRATRWDPAY